MTPKSKKSTKKTGFSLSRLFSYNYVLTYAVLFTIALIFTRSFFASVFIALFAFLIIGHNLFNTSENYTKGENETGNRLPFYDEHFAVLMVGIMRSDANVDPRQMAYIIDRVEREYFKRDAQRIIERIAFFEKVEHLNIKRIFTEIAENYYTEAKIQLLHIIVALAVIDGVLTVGENQFLQNYCRGVGLPYQILDRILAMFKFKHEFEQEQRKKSSYTSVSQLQNAFKVLGINQDATADEIKKAYKKLAKIHHPDKVIQQPEAIQKMALEQFKIIANAYDLICKKKGIV